MAATKLCGVRALVGSVRVETEASLLWGRFVRFLASSLNRCALGYFCALTSLRLRFAFSFILLTEEWRRERLLRSWERRPRALLM